MAQTIKLKRSSTEGKIPTTSQLALGEIAINTFDGRIFFEKNDGSATIEQILTTDSITTGSITITGSLQTDNITIDNATISSDLDITLDSAGDIILDADATDIILKDGGTEFGRFKRDSSNFVIKSATSDKDIIFKGVDNSSTITALTLDMSDAGSATFNNHVTVGDDCTVTGNLGVGALNASYGFYNNTTSYLNGNTTVNANLTVDAGAISISGDGANAATLTETGAGLLTIATVDDLVLDSGADITIDAGGNDIRLFSSGTEFGKFKSDSSHLSLYSSIQDKDILFKGNDGGSTITALTLDMSAAGAATFHGGIAEAGTISEGTWNADVIASAYLDSDTAHLSGTQTFSGTKTFTGDSKFTGQTNFQIMGDSNAIFVSSSATYDPSNDTGKLFIGGYQSGNTAISGIIIDYYDPAVKLTSELVTTNGIDIQIQNQSTSKTTGALKVAGGVGIAKTLNVGEDVVAYASSDERYKDNIIPIRNPNEKIKQIGGYTFDWNDKHEIFKGKKDIGVVAQEIEKVLPEIVETRDNGYKAVKYEKIVALLIESNKELIKRVEELESKIK